jgi:exosortase O
VPLGVIGFIVACGMVAVLLRWVPRRDARTSAGSKENQSWLWRAGRSSQVIPLLLCLVLLTLVPLPSQVAIAPSFSQFSLSPDIQTQVEPLTAQEKQFFADYPAVSAQKLRFQQGSMTGSLLLVHSPTWRAHHTPEACLLGSGYTLDGMVQRQFSETLAGRWISLNGGTHSAAYWFQSPQGTTDDFLTRLWAEVTRRESSWTLVSILFDQAYEPTHSGVQTFLTTVQSGVERSLRSTITTQQSAA